MQIINWFSAGIALTLIAGLFMGAPAQAAGVNSDWSTDFGYMQLHVDDNLRVAGRYDHKGGRIKGRMSVNGRITAYWLQTSAGRRCHQPVHGSWYWGVVVWNVTRDGDLSGSWSYCRDSVGSGGEWSGFLEAGPSPLVLVGGDRPARRGSAEDAAGEAFINLLDALTER